MLRFPARRPGPALVISCLALFVALGGTGYAAITISGKNVKNSSLTGADVKNNSLSGADVQGIRSGDVTDGSLQARDFEAGQLPKGQKGDPGLNGQKGDRGTDGTDGTDGKDGVGPAYAIVHDAEVKFSNTAYSTIATLPSLPAGSYAISAKAFVSRYDNTNHNVTCRLLAGSDADESEVVLGPNAPGVEETPIPFQIVHVFTSGGSAVVQCKTFTGSYYVGRIKITAIRVTSVRNTAG